MNLHLLQGYNFAHPAIRLFERYDPGNNWYVFPDDRNDESKVANLSPTPEVWPYLLHSKKSQKELLLKIEQMGVDRLFVHMLTKRKAGLISWLKQHTQLTIYWLFFGADLYTPLEERSKYTLFDDPLPEWRKTINLCLGDVPSMLRFGKTRSKTLREGIAAVDYFCFWNEYDYELMKQHFVTGAKYEKFLYYDLIDRHSFTNLEKSRGTVLLNHSASPSGNHLSMLRRLKRLDSEGEMHLTLPLSYGSPEIRTASIHLGEELFPGRCEALTDYLPQPEYYAKLNSFAAAIFGNRRQEAAGNVFYLLAAGVKVFLREDNTMLRWLKERGFIVFSVEEHLLSFVDISPLSPEDALKNHQTHAALFSEDNEVSMMQRLLQVSALNHN